MTHTQLVAELLTLRGSGAWERIADGAGIGYYTLARIARGTIPNPGVKTCERIEAAMRAVRSSPAVAKA